FYGLLGARELCRAPVVISIQGLLHQIAKPRAFFGDTPWRNIMEICRPAHLPRDLVRLLRYVQFRAAAKRELEILRGNRWFMGRTSWDRACLEAVNRNAKYFHVPELLRSEFYAAQWDVARCRRHRIIFTNANAFYRGTEVLLEAMAILKREFKDVTLTIAGADRRKSYGHKLMRTASRLGIGDSVQTLDYINARQMVDQLCSAHVYAIASFAENSPNSLCEAQLVGMPCVASYVGGIPSLVEEGVTGLLFAPGDAAVLARRIKDIFLDDALAQALGTNARQTALRRHDPVSVTNCVLETYRAVIADWTTGQKQSLHQ
ncbi:MAG: glycosyltransferase family 4 protein, partial [Pirellulales bacterium]|nr:glycosyltransferase family 4 protein [Pirellulales bacterium]